MISTLIGFLARYTVGLRILRLCYEHVVRLSVCLSICNIGGL